MVVGTTTATPTRTIIDETTVTIAMITVVAGSTRVAIRIAVMAITISAIILENTIYDRINQRANDRASYESYRRMEYDTTHGPPGLK